MNRRATLACLVAASLGWNAMMFASDQIPGAPQKKTIVIRNATIHPVSGDTIEKGSIIFKDGKITEIGANLAFPGDAEVIDAEGNHVYPGLVDSYCNVGLIEIESVRATIDTTETGTINPNVRSAVAFNPDSDAIPVARANGVLTALVSPTGGLISGRSSLMMLDGWTWESMTLQPDSAMTVNWPRFAAGRFRGGRGGPPGAGPEDAGAADSDPLKPLHDLVRESKAYLTARAQSPDDTPVDLRLEAMKPVLDKKMPFLVNANSLKQIQTAVGFAKQYDLKIIILGGADAPHCAELLKETNTPVIVASVYRIPSRRDAAYDAAYTLPAELQAAGVKFSIAGDNRFGASAVRNLPYHAGTAIGFGLSEADALKAITLWPAEIFGVDKQIGSLAVGKDATLFISTGNVFDTASNVTTAYIQGRKVDLTSRHTQLYEKYKAKYKPQ